MLRNLLSNIVFAAAVLITGAAFALEPGEYTVELNGLKHWYKVSGSGPVCIIPSPAWGCSSDLYFLTLGPLEDYFTLVYLDSRGCGRSEKPQSATEYTWDILVSDLEAFRLHLNQEKVWLMGHSESGIEVIHYACKHPGHVAGLVLFGTSAAIGPQDEVAALGRAMKRKDEPWFGEMLKQLAAGPPTTDEEMAANMEKMRPIYWSNPERFEKYKAEFAATDVSAVALSAQQQSRRMHFDLTKELANVDAPALIVVGDKDELCPLYMSRTLHLGLTNSKLLVLQDCGHFAWLEQAEEFETELPRYLNALGVHRERAPDARE